MKTTIVVITVILAVLWLADKAYQKFYINAEKKPFWSGTERIQVCKVPYYYVSNEVCYKLNVTLIDNKTAKIHFPNGGSKTTGDITCYFAANVDESPRYAFCRSWDGNGQQWDFFPAWVNEEYRFER